MHRTVFFAMCLPPLCASVGVCCVSRKVPSADTIPCLTDVPPMSRHISVSYTHLGVSAEIAGVRFLPMDNQDRAADLINVLQDRLIQKGHTSGHVPSAIGVQRSGMISSLCLIVVIVIFDKTRRVLRQRVCHAAAARVLSVFIVLHTLRVQHPALFIAGVRGIFRVKIAFRVDAGHIIHGCLLYTSSCV